MMAESHGLAIDDDVELMLCSRGPGQLYLNDVGAIYRQITLDSQAAARTEG